MSAVALSKGLPLVADEGWWAMDLRFGRLDLGNVESMLVA